MPGIRGDLTYPYAGFGIGLRDCHFESIIAQRPDCDWLEIVSEDYMVAGGRPRDFIQRIKSDYPLVMHGVSMSLGSTDPLNWDYLKQLKQLADELQPLWISDHCCWTGTNGINLHDLMPLPYTEEALSHMVTRIRQVQDFLGQRLVIENVSSYISYKASAMTEWEFLSAMCYEADCLLLLDINNIYVSAFNHCFDPRVYIDSIPVERVQQFHLAGHHHCGTHIIDTHDSDIIDAVWDLYGYAAKRFGPVSTLIERDNHIPPLSELMQVLSQSRRLAEPLWKHQVAV